MKQARSKRRDSEATTDSIASTPETDNSARSSRRSRVPKRFHDDEYTPPAAKRRLVQSTRTSISSDAENLIASRAPSRSTPVPRQNTPSTNSIAQSKPKGRPKKVGRKKKEKEPWEEEVEDDVVVTYDSDHESDEDFPSPSKEYEHDIEEEEEDLLLEVKPEVFADEPAQSSIWVELDQETIPKLELPESSEDLPLPKNAIMDSIEIYDILRSYHRTLRLTPFAYEDFLAGLISKTNSCIMAEIHMCLLRVCLKSDDEEQTHFSVSDTNTGVNVYIHSMDQMTYAEILRLYIEAYPGVDSSVLDAINTDNYPYVSYEPKIVVLLFMCYRFLYSSEYRKLISNVGKFQNDDSCRVCGKSNGRIVGCSRCDASFHPECSCLDPFPDVLVCNLCTQNSIRGVADSLSFDETVDREPIRLMPIGRDRHGRIYWFIARRIFVQTHDDTELRYYTTAPQYYNLLKCLDPIFYEKELCDFLKEKFNMILEQMTITIEMSMDRRDSQMEQFAQKNSMTFRYDLISQNFPVMYLDRDNMRQIASILNQSSIEYALKNEIKQEDQEGHTLPPVKSEVEFDLSLIGIHQGRLINTFWCGGATEEELIQYFGNQINDEIVHEEHWRMGDVKNDHEFMKYVNYYSNNDMAESFQARKKIADKRKYISTKFCVMEDAPYNFQWGTSQNNFINGDSSIHAENLRFVISKLATNVPVELMHRRWPEQATKFKENLKRANTHGKLAHCLLQLDCALRKTLFVAQWWNGLGQLKFQRNTIEQREQQSKELQRVKKLESDALSKELDEKFIKVNYTRTNSPNFYILRQKGESYRNAGPNEMGGWKWISSKYSANTKERAQLPIIPILDEDSNLVIREDETIANRKAKKLHSLIGLIQQRKQDAVNREEDRQRTAASFSFARNCYSPSCNRQNTRRSVCADGDKGIVQSCYSVNCRNNFGKYCLSQSERKAKVNDVIGEGRAWKIPEPFDFMSNGVRNIFVVEKKIIRKLVKTAGRTMVYIPGFSTTAKMNTTVWNYPAPRPCFDLCWRWNTLNAHSLHAVALQLKLLWISIRWNEMEPEDKHPDRRVVIDMPTHDERRRIISHKEMGPFGQYERYLLEIEIIPLHNDEVEEDDEAWSSKKEREKMVARTSSRKRKQGGGKEIRKPRAIKKEWIDGVDLRLFEIKDYWKKYNEELSKYDQMKPAPLALHVVHVVPLNRPQQYNRVINTVPIQQTRLFPAPARNGGRPPTLEERNRPIGSVQMYNRGMPHRQNDKNPSPAYYPVNPSQAASNNFRTAATRPTPDYRYQQQPSTSRAVTGSEMPQRMSYVQGYSQNQFKARQYSNGYATPARMVPSAGRLVTQPIIRRIIPAPQRTAVVRSVGEPQHVEMRRMIVQQPSGGQLVEEAVAANTSDGDEQPPVIPRYDRNTVSVQEQPVEQARPVIRHTYTGTSTSQQPTLQRRMMGNNAVLIVKKAADGMIVRSHNGKDQLASAPVPGTIVAQQPKRLYSLKPVMGGQRQVMTAAGARVVRVAGPGEPIRRIIPNPNRTIQQDGEEIPEGVVQQRQFIVNPSQIRKTNVVPRGGATMQTAQQPQPMEKRMVTTVKPKQKVTTYRDFMASRGYLDSSRYLMPARPLILPFEFNEEEEREISEAIAREEELMRLEEENKSGGHGNYDNMGFQSSRQFISTDVIKQHPYVSNLLPSVNDTPDDKIIKQVLDIMFSQVCRWDKQYGWAKMHMKRARQKTDTEKIHLRKIRLNQREILLSEHIDRLKKEINKRRTKMENEAEQQCGLLTPWRKARSRPQKSSKQPKTSAVHVSSESHAKKEVLNPADITLGGDTFDYGKEEEQLKTEENAEPQKEQTEAQQQNNIEEREKRVSESDSIASGVARRRRTSKSDDDSNKTTRGTKERRLSESQNEESFGVKNDSMSDESRYAEIDKSILHCVCQKLYDSSKFYMACDMCSGWFHGECVAITEEQTKNMSSWTCQKCFEEERAVKDQPQLYCLCRTPYDNTKFYVGCDACQGWFHPECVKITAAAAEAANEYICPNCAENETQKGYESSSSEGSVTSRASSSLPLDRNDYSHVMQLLELLLEHRMSSPFRQPVNIMEFPDYLQVISKPMDLSTISLKVDNLDYTYLRDFVADVNLMFENAKKYNPQDHAVFKCAETMQEVFERRLMDVRDSIKQNHTSTNRKRLESVGNNTLDGSLDIETDQLLSIDPKTFSMYDY